MLPFRKVIGTVSAAVAVGTTAVKIVDVGVVAGPDDNGLAGLVGKPSVDSIFPVEFSNHFSHFVSNFLN